MEDAKPRPDDTAKPPRVSKPLVLTESFKAKARQVQRDQKLNRLVKHWAERPSWQRRAILICFVVLFLDGLVIGPIAHVVFGILGIPQQYAEFVVDVVGVAAWLGLGLVLTLHGPWLLFRKARLSLLEYFVVMNVLGIVFGLSALLLKDNEFNHPRDIWIAGLCVFIVGINWVTRGMGWGFWVATVKKFERPGLRMSYAVMGLMLPVFVAFPFFMLGVMGRARNVLGVNFEAWIWTLSGFWIVISVGSVFSVLRALQIHREAKELEARQELSEIFKDKKIPPALV